MSSHCTEVSNGVNRGILVAFLLLYARQIHGFAWIVCIWKFPVSDCIVQCVDTQTFNGIIELQMVNIHNWTDICVLILFFINLFYGKLITTFCSNKTNMVVNVQHTISFKNTRT